MERFYDNDPDKEREPFFGSNNNNEDDEDDDDDEDDEDDEVTSFIDQQGMVDIMHMDLAQTELNHQMVAQAIDLAKQSWFWTCRSSASKMTEIEKIYKRLIAMSRGIDDKKKEEK